MKGHLAPRRSLWTELARSPGVPQVALTGSKSILSHFQYLYGRVSPREVWELGIGGAACEMKKNQLLNRDEEIRFVVESMSRLAQNEGAVLIFEGVPGVGRSALLAEIRQKAAQSGIAALGGRGTPVGQNTAYDLMLQLSVSFPLKESELPLARTGAEQRILKALTGPDGDRLCVVTLDDLQWADDDSLLLLYRLANLIETFPVLIAATYAPHSGGRNRKLLDMLGSLPIARTMSLHPLPDSAMAKLAEEHGWPTVDERFLIESYRLTRGNPLLVHELFSHAQRMNVYPTAQGVMRLGLLRPPRLMQHLRNRLTELGPLARDTIMTLALFDDNGASLSELVAVLDVDEDQVSAAVTQGVRAALVLDEGPIHLANPLTGNLLSKMLSAPDREAMHTRIAEVLTGRGSSPSRAAHHLLKVRPSRNPLAIRILREAALESLADGRPRHAVRLLRRALDECMEDFSGEGQILELQQALLPHLGLAELLAGEPQATQTLQKAASVHITSEVAAHLHLASVEIQGSDSVGQALIQTDANAIYSGVYLDAAHAYTGIFQPVDQVPVLQTVGPIASPESAGSARCLLRLVTLMTDLSHGKWSTAWELEAYRLGKAFADRVDDALAQRALWLSALLLLIRGQLSAARRVLDSSEERRGEQDPGIGALSAVTAYGQGRLEEAVRLAQAVLDDGAFGGHTPNLVTTTAWTRLATTVLAQVMLERGEYAQAKLFLEPGMEALPAAKDLLSAPFFETRARFYAEQGKHEQGLGDLYRVHRVAEGRLRLRPLVSWQHVAASLIEAGKSSDAAALLRREQSISTSPRAAVEEAIFSRVEGLLLKHRGASELQRSVKLLDQAEEPLEILQSLLHAGVAYGRSGRRARARHFLRQARKLAIEHGAHALEGRVRREEAVLNMATEDHLFPQSTTWSALTQTESRIAALARDGMSNRAIATRYYVSVRTIEWHLSQVYRKLRVHSRHELRWVLDETPVHSLPPIRKSNV